MLALRSNNFMKLPAGLAPWAKHLQIFPEEISLVLGGYARQISPFIAPISSTSEDLNGEPNGYDGVARRGIYERLLLSELALADDFGDEFIRRSVMGEHLFLNLAKVAPNAKRVSIALFDAGAMQLGAPRIAHLAAFIVLARRAEAADAMFLWGVLQDAQQLVISDDTESSIKILLESRTAREVTETDASEWREKLSEVDKSADIWLVGSENMARFDETKSFSRLYVEENIELEKRELSLKIKSASGVEKQTILELPPPNVCTRLLRNPFETAQKIEFSSAKLDGKVTNFFFDNTGSKLFAKIDSNDVLCFAVQNMQSNGKIYPTIYRSDDSKKYAAVGRLKKAIVFVSKVDDETIRLEYRKHGFGLKEGSYQSSDAEIAFPEDENGLLQIYNARPKKFHYDEAAILDANRNLFLFSQLSKDRYESAEPVGATRVLATNVLAVTQTENQFLYIGCEDGNEHHLIVSISDKIERHSLAGKRLKRAMFGRGEMGKKVCAFEDEQGNWKILDEEKKERIMPRPKGEIVGVYHDARLAPTSGFFELMDDRRTVEFCWAYGRRKPILTANEEIVKIEFSPRSPILAYQTVGGELIIYSLTHRATIGRYSK
jgi:hypothetical protein